MKTKLLLLFLIFISIPVFAGDSKDTTKISSYNQKVFITQSVLPAKIQYEYIGEVKVYKGWRAAVRVYPKLAKKARKLGANAVINVRTSYPHLTGQAIRLQNLEDINEIKGIWY